MRKSVKFAGGMLGTCAVAGAMAVSLVATGGSAFAATAACTSRLTHSHSISSKGTVSDRTTLKNTCGKNYDEWEHGWTRSYTGASSIFHMYKDEDYPHWTETMVRRSVSKTGTITNTVTNTHG